MRLMLLVCLDGPSRVSSLKACVLADWWCWDALWKDFTSVAKLGLNFDIQTFFFKSPTVLCTFQRFINKGAQDKAIAQNLLCCAAISHKPAGFWVYWRHRELTNELSRAGVLAHVKSVTAGQGVETTSPSMQYSFDLSHLVTWIKMCLDLLSVYIAPPYYR